MFARSTQMQADVVRLSDGIAFVQNEVMPAVMGLDGCVGLSMIVDRDSGRCITTSAWLDAEAMRAGEFHVRSLRSRAAEIFGAEPRVDAWEIAVLHRMGQAQRGMFVRAVWMRVDPLRLAANITNYRLALLPAMEEMPGFCSASLLVDRESGRAVSSVAYDSRRTLDESREAAAGLRRTAVQENDIEVTEVGEFELVLAHLRVPETV